MDTQCEKCAMPTMEYQGMVECVVCPALAKKAKKLMKAKKKVDKETKRLENKISSVKETSKAKAIEEATMEERRRHEEVVRRERERIEREERERQIQLLREQEAEQLRRLEIIEKERLRVAALEAESLRLIEEAKAKAAMEAISVNTQTATSTTQSTIDDNTTLEELRRVKAQSIEEEHAAATRKRKEMEIKLAEDIKKIEEMEHRRKMGIASALESMNRDVLVAEHRRRLDAKSKLDAKISSLEQDLVNEEEETKIEIEEKRVEDEDRMISLLEEEAAAKAKAAEEAIRKAKAALEHVTSARREVIAQTIALAEQEAVAEAESIIKKDREDYKAPVILPSASDIKRENWETLRIEGRSVMTRRVMAGWVLLSQFCQGEECHSTPLITKDGKKECVVCGGCGDGKDGAYIEVDDYDIVPTNDELRAMRENGIMPDEEESDGYEITPATPRTISPTVDRSFQEIQQDFETKRNMVSKEIGRRMIDGWTLLDTSCPHCVMPLMMDTIGNTDICVLCGLVSTIQKTEASTIDTTDVPTKTVSVLPVELEGNADNIETQMVPSDAQTKSYNDDAETMYTTLPTIKETFRSAEEEGSVPADEGSDIPPSLSADEESDVPPSEATQEASDVLTFVAAEEGSELSASAKADEGSDLPSFATCDEGADVPGSKTFEKTQSPLQDDLTESIRQNSQRQRSSTLTPRSDPPASTKAVTKRKKAIDPAPINLCLSNKSSCDGHEAAEEDDEIAPPEILKVEETVSADEIFAMIQESHVDEELAIEATLSKEEVRDIVDIFVATNFDADVSDEVKEVVAKDLHRTMDEYSTPTAASDGVIHLEDMPSPQKFKFDMVASEDQQQHSIRGRSNKQRPTPESFCRPRGRTGMPPRPDSTTSVRSSPRRPPRSTTSRSPHNGTYVFTGGPSDMTSLGEMSRAESVATDALDSILDRIDAAKAILLRDNVSIHEQLAAASLIEKLAQAAVAVKNLERMDRF